MAVYRSPASLLLLFALRCTTGVSRRQRVPPLTPLATRCSRRTIKVAAFPTLLVFLHRRAAFTGNTGSLSLKRRALFAQRIQGLAMLRGGHRNNDAGIPEVSQGAVQAPEVTTEVRGAVGSHSFRRFFLAEGGAEISPWHDLPLRADTAGLYFMVTEIPKMTKPKMEIMTKEAGNPIAHDVKNGRLREYHGPIYWNYGFLPQTWEDPTVSHPELNVFGDNDPVDVVEIGSRQHAQGEVVPIKVLGALAMIDSGELDWKVIAIALDDELAAELDDIADVEARIPWVISGIREWFRWYKTPDGKALNSFGFGEAAVSKLEACQIIDETHHAWQKLRSGAVQTDLWTGLAHHTSK